MPLHMKRLPSCFFVSSEARGADYPRILPCSALLSLIFPLEGQWRPPSPLFNRDKGNRHACCSKLASGAHPLSSSSARDARGLPLFLLEHTTWQSSALPLERQGRPYSSLPFFFEKAGVGNRDREFEESEVANPARTSTFHKGVQGGG